MRKSHFVLRKRLWLPLAFIISAIFIIQSCSKYDTAHKTKEPEFTVNEAKEWWYGSFKKSPEYLEIEKKSAFAISNNLSEKKSPSWKRAITYRLGEFDVIEAPLVYETRRILLPQMGDIINTDEGKRIAEATSTRLLFFKSDDGSIQLRISTLVPTREYAKKKNYDLSSITLNNIPKDFQGYQMIRKWNEEQINTFLIKDGKRIQQQHIQRPEGSFELLKKDGGIFVIAKKQIPQKLLQVKEQKTTARSISPLFESKYECSSEWVPKMITVCVIVYESDEPTREVCEQHQSDNEYELQEKCGWTWYPDPPDDPCGSYGVCGGGGGDDGDGGGDPPTPPQEIRKDISDSCIAAQVDSALQFGIKNAITQFINTAFSNTDRFIIEFYDGPITGPDSTADAVTSTGPVPGFPGLFKTSIKFNTNKLTNTSAEYIGATVFHEMIHAWIDYKCPSTTDNINHHNLLSQNPSFGQMVDAIRGMYPNISLQDATDLAWGGLNKTFAWQNLDIFTKARAIQTNIDYKEADRGTPCNRTQQ